MLTNPQISIGYKGIWTHTSKLIPSKFQMRLFDVSGGENCGVGFKCRDKDACNAGACA